MTTPKRYAILGAQGKVGRMLTKLLPRIAGYPVEIITVSQRPAPQGNHVVWQLGAQLPNIAPCDAVIAMWGVTGADPLVLDKNTTLAQAAVSWGNMLKVDRIFHASSVAVYAPLETLLSEDSPRSPEGAYGQAKLDMEKAVSTCIEAPHQTHLRIGSVAGAESLFGNGKLKGSVTLDQFADGSGPRRSYIAPSDLARVLAQLCVVPVETLPTAVNVGTAQPVKMEDLAEAMGWPVTWRDAAPNTRQNAILNTDLLHQLVDLPDTASDPLHIARDVQAYWSET